MVEMLPRPPATLSWVNAMQASLPLLQERFWPVERRPPCQNAKRSRVSPVSIRVVVPDCRALGAVGKLPTSCECWLRSGALLGPGPQQRCALVSCQTSSVLGGQKMQNVWASIRNSPSPAFAPYMWAGCTVNEAVMPKASSRRFQKSHQAQQVLPVNWGLVMTRSFTNWKPPGDMPPAGKANMLQVK